MCRVSKGKKHGGKCEGREADKDQASSPATSSLSLQGGVGMEAVLKSITTIDPNLPWSERKRLMVIANGSWGDQAFMPPADPKDRLPGEGDSEEAKALQAKVSVPW